MVTNRMWGREIQESGIRREEIFITTKVWKSHQGYDSTLQACEKACDGSGYRT
jgi:diketogulonate reductase-like aldo/keto reductase